MAGFGGFVQQAQGSGGPAVGATFAVAFSTQNVVQGNRIIVAVSVWAASTVTTTSVTDSAGNTYVKEKSVVIDTTGEASIWSAPITVGDGTKPTVTAHFDQSTNEVALFVNEYSGLSSGSTGYTNGSAAASTVLSGGAQTITSGATSPVPAASNELAFTYFGDGGDNEASITPTAGWTQRGTSILGSNNAEGACADQNTVAGTGSNGSWSVSSPVGGTVGVVTVVYQLGLIGGVGGVGQNDITGMAWVT